MYICGMKENYNHKNRHKYYLKCHLIFCIKYRRKILYGKFDDDIKTRIEPYIPQAKDLWVLRQII